MTTRIVIADDHQLFREGLRSLLERQSDVRVVAEADDGHTAIEAVNRQHPDIAIIDVSMPGLNGIETTRRVIADSPQTRVIGLSMHSEKRFIVEMFKAGAHAYLLKSSAFSELASAIHAVNAGQPFVSPKLAGTFVKDYIGQLKTDEESPFSSLTGREREVLQLLAEGYTSKEIAQQLVISVHTAESYRKQVMEKLNLHNVAELTRYAIREGLSPLNM